MSAYRRRLRVRSAGAFAISALILSVALCVSTYEVTRWYLLDQRETLAVRQAMLDASVAKGLLASDSVEPVESLQGLTGGAAARSLVQVRGVWYSATVELSEQQVPTSLVDRVAEDGSGRQRTVVNGVPYIVVGVRLPDVNATYFRFVALSEYERTLSLLATTLFVVGTVTTLLGAAGGFLLSRRVLRPLGEIAEVTAAMSSGDLRRRLSLDHDPDLAPLANSFNEMADSLEQRIAREVRFTADVSHELRTPLTAVTSAVSLAQRVDLPERARFAVDVVGEQVDHLRRLTLELLEISRFDAGAMDLVLEETDVVTLTGEVLRAVGVPASVIDDRLGDNRFHPVDRRRYERVLANFLENAQRYGNGVVAVGLERVEHELIVSVDDGGPGVPEREREAIFGRFHRGVASTVPGAPKGTGLGLSLVDEHMRLHGGRVEIDDAPGGGARFAAIFPGERR